MKKNEDEMVQALKQAAWDDMAVLRQRRYDNLPKVRCGCDVMGCLGVPVKKLMITANTALGEHTREISVCKEHLSALKDTSHFSMGCKIG